MAALGKVPHELSGKNQQGRVKGFNNTKIISGSLANC